MIYSNQFAIGNKPIGIASLAAVLKKAGHQFRLFDCTKYSVLKPNEEFTDWNLSGEEILQFMRTRNNERMPIREKVTYDRLIGKVLAFPAYENWFDIGMPKDFNKVKKKISFKI
tara:strand:+ start:58 stop:399 length:342 start_codon:yes stop_codon:yes gene_type:complete